MCLIIYQAPVLQEAVLTYCTAHSLQDTLSHGVSMLRMNFSCWLSDRFDRYLKIKLSTLKREDEIWRASYRDFLTFPFVSLLSHPACSCSYPRCWIIAGWIILYANCPPHTSNHSPCNLTMSALLCHLNMLCLSLLLCCAICFHDTTRALLQCCSGLSHPDEIFIEQRKMSVVS